MQFKPSIKSTWKDPIGVILTDRRITKRISEGWYGRIAQLRIQSRSTDKFKRQKAKEELKRFEGVVTKSRTKRVNSVIKLEEFC